MSNPVDRIGAGGRVGPTTPAAPPGRAIPDALLAPEAIERVARSLTDYIGVHAPVVDDAGDIVDAMLIWWNPAYERIRIVPVEYRQSMMATYFAPEVALAFVRQAMREGAAEQVFVLDTGTVDRYRAPDELVDIHVDWLRVGPLIVEVGSDNSQITSLAQRLDVQERETTAAVREHIRGLDRQRIERRLHDSAIQRLFATSLELQRVAPALAADPVDGGIDGATGGAEHVAAVVHQAIAMIDEVIGDIRRTVFGIEPGTE